MLVFNASAHQDTTRESDDLNFLSKFDLSVVVIQATQSAEVARKAPSSA